MMILGSDQRFGDKKLGIKPRSDTIILVRLDPDKEATAVMSIPRDLKVDIPGYGNDRVNSAYELGGPRLTVKTVKKLFADAGKPIKINHIINVDFGGFRKVVNYIGGVYVDIDRDYFNDNSGGESFATIDVNPGYQKLKGQDALDYVRYRHGDNDLVRAARQQDFLRQLRNAAGARKLLDYRRRRQLATIFARYTDTDKGLRRKSDIFSLLKLVLFTGRKPVREVRFRIDLNNDPVYLTASKDKLAKTASEFLNAQASKKPRQTSRATDADRRSAASRKKRNRAADRAGPRGRPARGRGPGDRRRAAGPLPVLLPDAALPTARATRAPSRASTASATSARSSTAPTGSSSPRASSASTTGSRARPGASRRSWTTRRRPARSTAASSSCTTTAGGCGWSRGGRNGRSTGSPTP